MFEPDEFIFSKVAGFLKRRKKNSQELIISAVKLDEVKARLTIFARAITGNPIEIYPAEREGGYKNNSFFLPTRFAEFKVKENNLAFYLFRVVYLSVQKNMGLNFIGALEHTLEESRTEAERTSEEVLTYLFKEFPITEKIYEDLIEHFKSKGTAKKNGRFFISLR